MGTFLQPLYYMNNTLAQGCFVAATSGDVGRLKMNIGRDGLASLVRGALGRPMVRPSFFIQLLAWLAPATAVPSATWRLVTLAGIYGPRHPVTLAMRSEIFDVLLVSFGSVALLSLTVGLVRPWGERFPDWLPMVGGRPVARRLALVPAFTGGLILTALSLYVLSGIRADGGGEGAVQLDGPSLLLVQLCYAPLLLAGPILLLVANDYRRRSAERG